MIVSFLFIFGRRCHGEICPSRGVLNRESISDKCQSLNLDEIMEVNLSD